MRAVGGTASRLAAPIVARRGGGALVRLKSAWTEVAGGEFAAVAWPEALGRDGTLKVRVAPAAAVELQHRAPLLLERINLFFGHRAAARLVLVQAPLPLPVVSRRERAAPLSAADAAALEGRLAGIAVPELREALAGLGRLVLPATRRR